MAITIPHHAGAKPCTPPPWIVGFYRTAVGKKYVMAVSGIILMGYVLAHMIGNLKLYMGQGDMDAYAEWLREIGYPALPETGLLWLMRTVLIAAFVGHIHAAYVISRKNLRAKPVNYLKQDFIAADFAGRTMRWSGVIVGLFVIFHLLDLTTGQANPQFVYGQVYANVVASFSRPLVAVVYIVANVALGYHLYHGAWSLFQTMGWNNRRFNHWRRYFAVAFAVVVAMGNITFPIAVLTSIVS